VLDWRHRSAGVHIAAAGPPITVGDSHCANMGGAASGTDELLAAVDERAARGLDVVKIMASGGLMTPGTDVHACQFTLDELRLVVDRAHTLGLPATAHAHPLIAVVRALEAGVDGIEHCSCFTPDGVRTPPDLARAREARHGGQPDPWACGGRAPAAPIARAAGPVRSHVGAASRRSPRFSRRVCGSSAAAMEASAPASRTASCLKRSST
jgi:hypothetical protein